MIYIISDIHGCYDEYMELLRKINFKDSDELYILGDVVDKGPHPIKVIQDMMMRTNVFPIIGNHDYIALLMLKKLSVEITSENVDSIMTNDDMLSYMHWMSDGGETTIKEFKTLDMEEREDILEYLEEEFSIYHKLIVKDKRYILVHAGINKFDETKELEEYDLKDLLFYRTDYSKRYFSEKNTYLVTGHTPTVKIRDDGRSLIYKANGHIAIDCGCVYGGHLAAYCVDTDEMFYVKAKKEREV